MKQIDMIKSYSQKRCLVVETNPDLRTLLKRALVDFGSEDVDTAGHAEEAIDLCQRRQYDIVLADYELGKGRTGQQLLEELRFQGLFNNTGIFFLISSEVATQHVVHAIEYQPDDYISKPINRDALRPRLDNAVQKKAALIEVNKALDKKRPRSAIAACQDLINEGESKFIPDARKILGELMCDQGMFEEAKHMYSGIPADKRPLWAQLGLARACQCLKELDSAEAQLHGIVSENDYCVEAHDALAKVYEAKHKFDKAQGALIKAVTISPMSAKRQRDMGRVCTLAGDKNAAAHAYRAAIKYSKNTCQERAEDYTELANTLTQMMDGGDTQALTTETLEVLQVVDKKYSNQPVVQMRSKLLAADLYDNMDRHDDAKKTEAKALEIYESLNFSVVENTSTRLCIDCAKAFMARGLYDEGERLLQEVAKLNNDSELSIEIDKLLREPITKEGIAFASKLNKKGIDFHKKNQFDEAIAAFQKVLKELPNHIGLNLNLIQTVVTKSKERELKEKELALMTSSFQRIGELRDSSPYKERYDYLHKRFKKLSDQ